MSQAVDQSWAATKKLLLAPSSSFRFIVVRGEVVVSDRHSDHVRIASNTIKTLVLKVRLKFVVVIVVLAPPRRLLYAVTVVGPAVAVALNCYDFAQYGRIATGTALLSDSLSSCYWLESVLLLLQFVCRFLFFLRVLETDFVVIFSYLLLSKLVQFNYLILWLNLLISSWRRNFSN